MQKTLVMSLSLTLSVGLLAFASQGADTESNEASQVASVSPSPVRPELEKQNVFVFCPHTEGRGAWSLYVVVDKNNPRKPISMGLEELPGKNSKELTYKGVLDAQKDSATPRTELSRIDAKDFATGSLNVSENNMLSIKVAETNEGLKLTVDARVSLDDRFVVGGPNANHGELMLQYSGIYKCWQIKAKKLDNLEGRNVVGKYAMTLSGIIFSAGSTRVSRICAVDEFGSPTILMDR